MKFLCTFAYTADVLPRLSRKARREVLFAQTELEMRDVAKSDLAHDAVVVVSAPKHGDRLERVAFAGYDGALWTPLHADPIYTGRKRSDVKAFMATCKVPYPVHNPTDNPLSTAFDDTYGPKDHPRNDDGAVMTRLSEDNYDGKIIDRSGRTAAIERCQRIASQQLLHVDGDVYVRRPEPVWEVERPKAPEALLRAAPGTTEGTHFFRLDRLGAVQDWIASQYRGAYPVRGEIERLDPAFLSRDDLSHFLAWHLRPLISDTKTYLPYLDVPALTAWHRLAQRKDGIGRIDCPFPAPLEDALSDLRRLRQALETVRLPRDYLDSHDKFLRQTVAPLFQRIEFECVRRPQLSLDEADDDALSKFGSVPV